MDFCQTQTAFCDKKKIQMNWLGMLLLVCTAAAKKNGGVVDHQDLLETQKQWKGVEINFGKLGKVGIGFGLVGFGCVLIRNIAGVGKGLKEVGDEFNKNLKEVGKGLKEVGDELNTNIKEVGKGLKEVGDELNENIKEGVNNVEAGLRNIGAGNANGPTLSQSISEVGDGLKMLGNSIDAGLNGGLKSLGIGIAVAAFILKSNNVIEALGLLAVVGVGAQIGWMMIGWTMIYQSNPNIPIVESM